MFEQILSLVGEPPGSLVYHFITLFAVEAALAIALGQWLRDRGESTGRLAITTLGIGLARAMLLVASLLAWQGYLPRNAILPPIERTVDAITALGLVWAFITMDDPILLRRNLGPDALTSVALAVILVGYAATGYYWLAAARIGALFNGQWVDLAWAVIQLTILIGGLLWMLGRIHYVYDPFLKGAILVVLAGAVGAHLVDPVLGDVAAAMRLGQAIAMPALAAVAYRHVVEQLLHWDAFQPAAAAVPSTTPPMFQEPPTDVEEPLPFSVPPPTFLELPVVDTPPPPPSTLEETLPAPIPPAEKEHERPKGEPALLEVVEALEGLFATLDPEEISLGISHAIAAALRSDIALFATVDQESHQAVISGGYDNIAQTYFPKIILALADHPTVVNALGRLRQLWLTPQRNLRELEALYSKLGITHNGPAYVQPLTHGEERIGVLIVGCPYSRRLLSDEERNLLGHLAPLVTTALLNAQALREAENRAEIVALQESSRLAVLEQELESTTEALHNAQRQIREMGDYIRETHHQLEVAPQQQREAQERIQAISQENERLKAEITRLQSYPLPPGESFSPQNQSPAQPSEIHFSAQSEIASLRARLATAAIAQQEILFLQEQLGAKAREAIGLQARLTEAQAIADALRSQLGVGGDMGALQMRIAGQATEIANLKVQLAEARANAALGTKATPQQEAVEAADRDAMAQLEAQLAERSAQIEALEEQLAEKVRATSELRAHMAEVDASLRALEAQLAHKTDEVATLQESLAKTRTEAQERIAALQAALDAGTGDQASVDRAGIDALEADLEERTAAVQVLEDQLAQANASLTALERRLGETSAAVEDAISEARRIDNHDEVIAAIAQELRTPMSSIVGYTDLLLNEEIGILGSLQREFLQRVKANIVRMSALLDDLIHVTMLDTGRLALEPQKVDLLYTLEEVIVEQAPQLHEKRLTLRLAVPDKLPPITADRDALYQIMSNLLSNAALASPESGQIHVAVLVEMASLTTPDGAEHDVECLHFLVEDSGGGVAEEDVERVFARKYRTDHPLIAGLGDTGVGLSLAKTLVDIHGGRIWVESQSGIGTVFHVLLPIQPLAEEEVS